MCQNKGNIKKVEVKESITKYMEKISIIIPLYNGEKYIERCIKSIIEQSFTNIEIIIINDASSDRSLQIIQAMRCNDSRIKIINKYQNEGPMVARSQGIEIATGEYCCFCDADDWLPENSLTNLYEAAKRSGAEIVIGDAYRINESGRTYPLLRSKYANSGAIQYLKAMYSGVICSMWGMLFKTDTLRKASVPLYKGIKMSEDRLVLTYILLTIPKIYGVAANTYYYYYNKLSSTNKRLSDKDFFLQMNTLKQCYEVVRSNDFMHKEIIRWFTSYSLFYMEQGYPIGKYCLKDREIQKILKFSKIKENCGIVLAIHFLLCSKSKLYRKFAQSGRTLIRKIQHKV